MTRRSPKRTKMKRATALPTVQGRAGRKGSYQPWMADDAQELCGKLGARIIDLAEYFNVCPATIDYWITHRPDFERAVKKGRLECTLKVSQALYHRATGYSHPDVHILTNRVKVYDEKGNVIEEHTEPLMVNIIKHYPPDPTSAIKYLTIMARDQGWSEITRVNMDINHSGDVNIHQVSELSMEDLSEEARALLFEVNLKQLQDVQSN